MNKEETDRGDRKTLKDELVAVLHQSIVEVQHVADNESSPENDEADLKKNVATEPAKTEDKAGK